MFPLNMQSLGEAKGKISHRALPQQVKGQIYRVNALFSGV